MMFGFQPRSLKDPAERIRDLAAEAQALGLDPAPGSAGVGPRQGVDPSDYVGDDSGGIGGIGGVSGVGGAAAASGLRSSTAALEQRLLAQSNEIMQRILMEARQITMMLDQLLQSAGLGGLGLGGMSASQGFGAGGIGALGGPGGAGGLGNFGAGQPFGQQFGQPFGQQFRQLPSLDDLSSQTGCGAQMGHGGFGSQAGDTPFSMPANVPATSDASGFVQPGGSGGAPTSTVGGPLSANKQAILNACRAQGASPQETAIIMAIGDQETQHMDASERDRSKDGTAAANCSCFNLNISMLRALGYRGDGSELNSRGGVGEAVGYMLQGMRSWGVDGFLAYQRGGSTGFENRGMGQVNEYRANIQKIASALMSSPDMFTNDRRIDVTTSHC